MICQANMYKSNARQSLRTSQIVQNALLNNKGILSDHMGSLLQSDIVGSRSALRTDNTNTQTQPIDWLFVVIPTLAHNKDNAVQ